MVVPFRECAGCGARGAKGRSTSRPAQERGSLRPAAPCDIRQALIELKLGADAGITTFLTELHIYILPENS